MTTPADTGGGNSDGDGDGGVGGDPRWSLTVHVAGVSPRSAEAIDTARRICDQEWAGRVELAVIDVSEQPALAVTDGIFAVPTLVNRLPAPLRRLVGNLADVDRVRAGLDLGLVPSSTSIPGTQGSAGERPAAR